MKEVKMISEARLDQASDWLIRLKSDHVSENDKVEFALWLSAEKYNRAAFDQVVALWDSFGTKGVAEEFADALHQSLTEDFDEACDEPADEDIKNNHISNMVRTHSYAPAAAITPKVDIDGVADTKPENMSTRVHNISRRGPLSKLNGKYLYSSALAACLMLVVWLVKPSSTPVEHPSIVYSTEAGEQRTVTLRDGSRIDLNTKTSVEVDYSEDGRAIKLLEGEAFFSVTPNKDRPFTVDFGHGTVRVLGTAFNVNRHSNNVFNISVLEGHVRVAEKENSTNPEPKIQDLVESQQITFNHQGLGIPHIVDLTKILSWRDQTIVFDRTPLSDAISQLNRYLVTPVDASDNSLQTIEVSGTFALDSPRDTLAAIKTTFNLVEKGSKLMADCEG